MITGGVKDNVTAYLHGLNPALMVEISKTTTSLAIQLVAYIKSQKLNGQVLKNRTGNLSRSINQKVTESSNSVTAVVGAGENAPYARIHEYGGKTSPHIIEARNAKALAFMSGGKQIIVKRVNHPGSVMPERSFLRTALAEFEPKIMEQYNAAVALGIKNAAK